MAKKTLAPSFEDGVTDVKAARPATPGATKGMATPKRLAGNEGNGMDPSVGTAIPRRAIYERQGARRRIDVSLPGPESPEAYSTQANGRIIRGYGKARDNFGEGSMGS